MSIPVAATNGISREAISRALFVIVPVVLSATVTWTISQATLRDHEKRITIMEQIQADDRAKQMQKLEEANAKLQALLEAQAQAKAKDEAEQNVLRKRGGGR